MATTSLNAYIALLIIILLSNVIRRLVVADGVIMMYWGTSSAYLFLLLLLLPSFSWRCCCCCFYAFPLHNFVFQLVISCHFFPCQRLNYYWSRINQNSFITVQLLHVPWVSKHHRLIAVDKNKFNHLVREQQVLQV